MTERTFEEACGVVLRAIGLHNHGDEPPSLYWWHTHDEHGPSYVTIDANFFVEQVVPWVAAKGWIGCFEWDRHGFDAVIWPGVGEERIGLAESPSLVEAGMLALAEALESAAD